MPNKIFLIVLLFSTGLYWLLKGHTSSTPKGKHDRTLSSSDHVTSKTVSITKAENTSVKEMNIEPKETKAIGLNKELENKTGIDSIKSEARESNAIAEEKAKDYSEVFLGLDTTPWLYRLRPGDTKNINVICKEHGVNHSADLFIRLIDLEDGDYITFEENTSLTVTNKELTTTENESITFVRGEAQRVGDSPTEAIDTPACKIVFSRKEIPKDDHSLEKFDIGRVEPFKVSSTIAGVRIYRKDHDNKSNKYSVIKSIECFVRSEKENDEKYLQLNMRHLSATLGTNGTLFQRSNH